MNVVTVSVAAVTGRVPPAFTALRVCTRHWAQLSLLLAVLLRAFLDPSRVVMKWNRASRVGGMKTV